MKESKLDSVVVSEEVSHIDVGFFLDNFNLGLGSDGDISVSSSGGVPGV
jgi:hypothetical protein